jgi:hypothetical protein
VVECGSVRRKCRTEHPGPDQQVERQVGEVKMVERRDCNEAEESRSGNGCRNAEAEQETGGKRRGSE